MMWRTWLKSGFEFSTKAASAALFGILLLIAFAFTAPMASQEYFGFFRYDYLLFYALIIQVCLLETFARNSPFARGIPPNRKKTKNGNEISKTMAKSWIKSPNGC